MPLISVIMPVFNASDYIREAIESILNQTESDFEFLICDDGSTDNSLSIIKSYNDKRIRIFENKVNSGNLKTTNLLFSKCSGDFIVIQDADDYSDVNRFKIQLREFYSDNGIGMVGSNYEIFSGNHNSISCGFLPLENETIKQVMQKEVIPVLYASVMVKKNVLQKVGDFRIFFNRKGYADLDWLARCSENTKVVNCKDILYYYRSHETAFTFKEKTNKNLLLNNIHLLLVKAHKDRLLGKNDFFEKNNLKEMKKYISNNFVRRAENSFWEKDIKMSYSFLFKALNACFYNAKIYRTFLYIVKKSFVQ